MACPYFYPLVKAEDRKQPARAPLGVIYRGECQLGGASDSDVSNDACNFGYAAGRCDVFPQDAEIDAVRFTTFAGRTLYILEKNFSPVKHGEADSLQGALGRQADVFKEWATR